MRTEEDTPKVRTDYIAMANSHNTPNGVFKDERADSSCGGLTDSSEEGAGYTKAEGQDEASRLKALTTDMRDQDDLERDIGRQVGQGQ